MFFQEARRKAAAAAADRRLQEIETRGMDADEYHRMNKRHIERERIEQQQNRNETGGLRVSYLIISLSSLLVF